MKQSTAVSYCCQTLGRFLFLMMCSGLACSQNALVGMRAYVQDGMEVLRLDFAQEVTQTPRGFTLQSPPRITLELPGVDNRSRQDKWTFSLGKLESAQMFVAGDRARILMNLRQSAGYTSTLEGNSILIRLQAEVPQEAPVQQAAAPSAPAATAVPALPVLQDIDFKRSPEGAGVVQLRLPSDQTVADIRRQGTGVVIDLDKTRLPPTLRRRMDVGDFATPVQTITSTQAGDRVRVVIEPSGKWEFNALQVGNVLTVEIKPTDEKVAGAAKAGTSAGYTGQKLSLNFQSIEVRSVLQVIADFTKFNIVTSDTVTGSVTLRLEDVPWDQALDIIMQSKGLAMRKKGNVIWVAPKEEIATREKLDYESQAVAQSMEPLVTKSFQINYAKAMEVAGKLKEDAAPSTAAPATGSTATSGSATAPAGAAAAGAANAVAPLSGSNRIMSNRGTVFAEPRTNQVFVTDTAASMERVQQFISKIDIPLRQVLIEARLVVASEDFGKSLGVKLGGIDGGGGSSLGGDMRATFGTNLNNSIAASNLSTLKLSASDTFLNLPASSSASAVPSIAFTLFNSASSQLIGLELQAIESNSTGKVVSSPRVLTMDQQAAVVSQGTQVPYTSTSSNGTSTTFQNANLKLEVTPQITPDGTLILTLDVTKDSLGILTTSGYAINTKHVKTQALVENGGTVVIGGIYELEENSSENKVPFFGDLPIIGNLFKNKAKSISKKELLVFVTPKIVMDRNLAAP